MKYNENFSLKLYNTFSINVFTKYFSSFSTVEYLQQILDTNIEKLLILGGGSNILFTKNFDGLVLKNEILGISKIKEDENFIYIKAGAGVGWHNFVLFCIENNYAGAENLSLIPGSVGASPMQNIGAYGVEIKDIFFELEAYHINDKKLVVFSKQDCQFGYRESIFKHQYKNEFVITTVTFKLHKIANFTTSYGAINVALEKMGVKELSIKAISDAVINIRNNKLPNPTVIGNAGSFFKNPTIGNEQFLHLKNEFPNIIGYAVGTEDTKLAAGWLIEQCGWKGYREGDVGCYQQQALVLVNYNNATGMEILDLSEKIISSVHQKFAVILEREVNVV